MKMRVKWRCLVGLLTGMALSLAGMARIQADSPTTAPQNEQTFGTQIAWTDDWDAARDQARSNGRLLLVLHLSGNFTKSEFT